MKARFKPNKKTIENRSVAKLYGAKALTGSAKQKIWAEEIRKNVLESGLLPDEKKIALLEFSDVVNTAKFWINNREKSPSCFDVDIILKEIEMLKDLYTKHYDVLTGTSKTSEKIKARDEIYSALKNLTISFEFDFPNCDFYDEYGNLK